MPHNTLGDIVIGRSFFQVAPDSPLRDACRTLCRSDTLALAVVEDGILVGVLSEHDVIFKAICSSRPIADVRVADVMTRQLTTVELSTPTEEALALMRARKLRHLPVLQEGRPVAILSVPDVPAMDRLMVERYADCDSDAA